MRIRLQSGKYEQQQPTETLPEQDRPERTFNAWDALAEFLGKELSSNDVSPIQTPPELSPLELLQTELIHRGLESNFEAVRYFSQIALHIKEQADRARA